MKYVFSTLTASNTYTKTVPGGGDMPVTERAVTIKGGSNLPSKHMLTSIGYMTEVTDEDYEWLAQHPVFKLHMENGFIKVENKKADAEKVATEMETRDQSAPLVDADFDAPPAGVNTDGLEGSFKPTAAAEDDDKPAKGRNSRKA
jgi:hypothetical protein